MRSKLLFSTPVLQPHRRFLICGLLCCNLMLTACQDKPTATPTSEAQKIELIAADLVQIQNGSAIDKVAFTGTIRAVNQSSIQAQVSATATAVQAEVGQQVSKGQVLVRLNNQDNSARLAQARANLASTQAQANQSKLMMQRKKRLLDQGFIAKVEYEQSQVDYQAQIENVRAQQASVDIALKAEQDGIIRSPIDGVITQRQVEPGQTVAIGQTLFEIVDPNHLEIQATLPNDQQQLLNLGQKLEYRLAGQNALLTARVTRISPVVNQASRQIEFFAQPQQPINSLSIGAFIQGDLISEQQIAGQMIPLNTIQDINSKPFVWVIRQGKIEQAAVKVIQQNYSNNSAVVAGLQNNDQVSRVAFSPSNLHQSVVITP